MLAQRVASGALLAPILLAIVFVGQPLIGVAVTVVAFFAARELFALLTRAGIRGASLLGPVLASMIVLSAWLLPVRAPAIAATALIFGAVIALQEPDPRDGFRVWVGTAFGALYVALLAFVVLIADRAPQLPPAAPIGQWLDAGRAWVLALVLGVWSYDTGAYAVGRAFGRNKLIPHISPGKTWEGVLGGTVAAVVTSIAMSWATGELQRGALGVLSAVVLGLLIAAGAQAGDLAESMLKRAAGAIESRLLIPGHGGLLDRVDSFLFAAPAVYLYVVTLVGR